MTQRNNNVLPSSRLLYVAQENERYHLLITVMKLHAVYHHFNVIEGNASVI